MKTLLTLIIGIFALISIERPGNIGNAEGKDKCIDCHGDLIEGSVVHPITEEGCDLCHSSTGKKHPGKEIGFKLTEPYPDLCYMCHDPKTTKEQVHTPVKDGNCSDCHSPHSTDNRSLILNDFSENTCLDCHYIETEDIKTVHGPVMKGDCQSCHDPHHSDNPYNLKKELKDMCLTCHDKEIESADRTLDAISPLLVEGNVIHGPVDNGDCTSCHLPHSGNFPYLLVSEYPVEQYADATAENFDLCFMCHDIDMLTQQNTDYATNFRNGTTNLHYLHINGNRGRNCNLCHNAHGAPREHILEETVLFGRWEMPMKLELNETGGSCATGCHKKLKYSRVIE